MSGKQTAPGRLAGWLTTDNLIDLVTTGAAALGVLFVAITGIGLSYDALWDLARAAGSINPTLTWLWPLTLDALAVVASLNVLWAEIRQERDRYAWTLVIAFTFLSVLFNATHASLPHLLGLHSLAPLVVSGFVGILPPIAAAFALHLLVRLLRRVLERISLLSNIAALEGERHQLHAAIARDRAEASAERARLADLLTEMTPQVETKRAELDRLRQEKRLAAGHAHRPPGADTSPATEARARAILAERSAAGDEPTGAELGRLLGKSASLGRRLKRKLWPEIVAQAGGSNGSHRASPGESAPALPAHTVGAAGSQPRNGHGTGLE